MHLWYFESTHLLTASRGRSQAYLDKAATKYLVCDLAPRDPIPAFPRRAHHNSATTQIQERED